jgi:hypothetical protein
VTSPRCLQQNVKQSATTNPNSSQSPRVQKKAFRLTRFSVKRISDNRGSTVFKIPVSTSQKYTLSISKTTQSIWLGIAVYFENRTEYINTLCQEGVGDLKVKAVGKYDLTSTVL